ncbi:MAG: metallophosphoesterase, partial [Pseudomonadota bacterium]
MTDEMAMLKNIPTFDELYVVSDIHMGGNQGFQILKHGPRLGAFIEKLADERPGDDVALVLNGDIIDSLAEDIDGFVAMEEAEAMMDRIAGDPAFKPIWDGLGKFVATSKRHLVFVLGNHDIELALPHVENWVRNRLAGSSLTRAGRITFATHGSGFGCRVGKARVFCTHGNEVDDWNIVNHDRLGQLGNALSAGRTVDRKAWEPNAGTEMVVKVMNEIKADYPFVDLLKPETSAVLGVLLVMAPERVKSLELKDVVSILSGKRKGSRITGRLLSADGEDDTLDDAATADETVHRLLGSELRGELATPNLDTGVLVSSEDLLSAVETDFAAGKSALEVEQSET